MLVYSQGRRWTVSTIKGNKLEMWHHDIKTNTVDCQVYDIVNSTYHKVDRLGRYSDGIVYNSSGTKVGEIECGIIEILFQAKVSVSELVQVLKLREFNVKPGSKIIKKHGGGYEIIDAEDGLPFQSWEDLLLGHELDNLF